MVDALVEEIKRQQEEYEKLTVAATEDRETAEESLPRINQEIAGLVHSMTQHGYSEGLSNALRQREAQKDLLAQQIKRTEKKAHRTFDRGEVAVFLSDGLSRMADILLSDAELCREEIRKRVDFLVLTPATFEDHPAYEISGDLRLFTQGEPIMVSCNGYITANHSGLRLNLAGATLKLDSKGNILRVAQLQRDRSQAA